MIVCTRTFIRVDTFAKDLFTPSLATVSSPSPALFRREKYIHFDIGCLFTRFADTRLSRFVLSARASVRSHSRAALRTHTRTEPAGMAKKINGFKKTKTNLMQYENKTVKSL